MLTLAALQQFLESTHGYFLAWVSLILAAGLALFGLLNSRLKGIPMWGDGLLLLVAGMILLFGNSGDSALQTLYGGLLGGTGSLVLLSYVMHRSA